MKKLLEYQFPQDLKTMTENELELLSYEIRDFLISNISKTGGHLASNLGVVELSIALHKVFDTPTDKLIWDVGHQSYVHKILTGRAEGFQTLRKFGGMSGFPKVKESEYDTFDTGHSSTSISVAAGMAAARDLAKEDFKIAAIIGDGALTGGLAYEAMNNVGVSKTNLVVILNDNGMSIAPNTGGVSKYLSKLRGSRKYTDFKKRVKKNISEIPGIGKGVVSGMQHMRDSLKYAVLDGIMFEELGFKYFGPVDGHNMEVLLETLTMAKEVDGPVFIHVITKKGKGYKSAEETPSKYHGTGPFDPTTGRQHKSGGSVPSYSDVFGNKMIQMAKTNNKIVAIGAAMLEGTGLKGFKERYPARTFDVGIAEGHAVTFAAGMTAGGYRPVVAIYSTFLQRAYDQMIEDVCLQNLPVVFAIDRAGIVGADGETHHGMFDLSYLSHMPNMTILAPADRGELEQMLEYAMTLEGPCAIRYPRGEAMDLGLNCPIQGSLVIEEGRDVELWAVGNMLTVGFQVQEVLKKNSIDAGLIDARFVRPLDQKAITASAERTRLIVTLEDNVITGGFGENLAAAMMESPVKVLNFGWPDRFIEHGSIGQLFEKYGLNPESIAERICEYLEKQA
ncbi:1-deoxy-D-xylulose-5-phosphate synthase [Ihubacter massiliensis]|uniref:1-deoxy-D-xylulose-5-phosphate synthase n=1 Tax=Hominibacterium faecale TaxID=2839743 RepID=A0A9J6QTH3_9FIRM|nr:MULTISPECIES: 1-deoxy-D-xylulose-5-phosphate synthase [Eubacteriales Family XIII. Incertae Sedis]MCO7120987.1 1-deoxy-D-xylulose-5-phosphate synthase [Ihubacter massiliensis]MCU7377903.1 1-deoxy-D-xylulose-5-phosphate synthase [Hominibacterium faecale]